MPFRKPEAEGRVTRVEQSRTTVQDRPAELAALFESALPDIERVSRFIARRHRLSPAEAEDFRSEVNLTIIENNYSVLTSFLGRSSLRTYLTTVIQRLFLDYRRKCWGKWRPSAEARRRGPLALRLEMLLHRDGLTLEEALETMRANFACEESREALAELARALPPRPSRRPAAEVEDISALPADERSSPDVQLEGAETARRIQGFINGVMEALTPQDRIVLRMRFEDDISVADISRTLRLDQKRLYRRIEEMLHNFRKSLEDSGLVWPDVLRMIDRGQCHLCLPRNSSEKPSGRPSPSEAQA